MDRTVWNMQTPTSGDPLRARTSASTIHSNLPLKAHRFPMRRSSEPAKGSISIFINCFTFKKMKTVGEAASANEEAMDPEQTAKNNHRKEK